MSHHMHSCDGKGGGNAHLLQPDSLPDAFGAQVPDAFCGRGTALLAKRDMSTVRRVIHAHNQCVAAAVALLQGVRDVHIELVIAAPIAGSYSIRSSSCMHAQKCFCHY